MCISMWTQCMTEPIAYTSRPVKRRIASVVTLSFVSIAPIQQYINTDQLSQRSTYVSSSGRVHPIATMSASISSQTVASLETLQG